MLVQQVGKIVPSFCEKRVSARRSAERRFRFNVPTVSPEHISEIEWWRRIGGIAFHQQAVEALGFGNVSGLLCRLCLLKCAIAILLSGAERQHKLAALIGSPLRLFDFNGVVTGGMQPQIGQVGFREPCPDLLYAANDLRQSNPIRKQTRDLPSTCQIAKPEQTTSRGSSNPNRTSSFTVPL